MKARNAKHKATKPDFYKLRNSVGLGRQEDAENFLEISKRTLQRWDKEGAPHWAMRLLRYYDRWRLDGHGPEWRGFMMSRGRLVNAKAKLIFTPDRLKLWPSICARLDFLEAEAERRPECPVMRAMRKVLTWAKQSTGESRHERQR